MEVQEQTPRKNGSLEQKLRKSNKDEPEHTRAHTHTQKNITINQQRKKQTLTSVGRE